MLPAAIRQPTLWSGTSSLLEWALWRWSLDMPWQWAFRVIHGCFDQQKWWFQHVSTCFNMFQPRNIDTATMTSMVMFKNQVVILKQDSTDILLTRDFCHVVFFFLTSLNADLVDGPEDQPPASRHLAYRHWLGPNLSWPATGSATFLLTTGSNCQYMSQDC